jgi:hypothetical protein
MAMRAHETKLLVAYYAYVGLSRQKIFFFNILKKQIFDSFDASVSSLNYFLTVKRQA